ncbi:MAG: hypothetical protein K0S12_1437 [Bacteroidetes bacterium]|jgi:serine phosphatase RsbU (regulator of sigma subunit)/Flp pilus assembly protein TadD|nr:hypothetical protein [Bacteroidota bacterium]
MHFKSEIEEQLRLIVEGKAEPASFFPILWRNGILLEGNQFSELLQRATDLFPTDPKIESLILFSGAIEFFLSARHIEMFDRLAVALEKFKELGDLEGEGAAHSAMAMTYMNMGQTERARNHFHQALSKLTKEGIYAHFLKMSLYQAGELHSGLKEYNEAIDFFERGLEVTDNDRRMHARMLNGIGNIHLRKSEYDQALRFFKESLEKSKGDDNILLETRNYSDIATYYTKTGDIPKAKEFIEKSLDLRLKHNIANSMMAPAITNYLQLSNIYFEEKNFEVALSNAQKALELASKLKVITRLAEVSEMLYRIYEAKGDMSNALLHFKNYHKHKEEVLNLETARKMKQIEIHHEVERMKQEKEIFRLRNVELRSALNDIEASIQYAKRLQDAMLPNVALFNENFREHFILYKPKDIVSGDFYWLDRKGDTLFLAVGDCTGHGVPGAMVSILCQTALNRALNEFDCTRPSDVLNKTRELLIAAFMKSEFDVKDGMDISLCSLCLTSNKLIFSGANNPLYLLTDDNLQEIKGDKQPVGHFPDMKPFNDQTFQLNQGDILYLFSDGYADQFGGGLGKKFKYSQMKELLYSNYKLTMNEQGKKLNSAFNEWKSNFEQVDDVTVVGIRI